MFRLMSEADWSQMLDLHVMVAGFLWAFCCWENTPEWGREELPWCRCDHELQSTSIVSPPSLEDQVKTRSNKRKQRFGNFCTCVTHYGISKWENWVFLIFAKGRQIRGCLLGHMHKSGNSAAGGGKTFPLQNWGLGTLMSYSCVKKREFGDPLGHHAEYNLFGLGCLNPQIISCTFNQE